MTPHNFNAGTRWGCDQLQAPVVLLLWQGLRCVQKPIWILRKRNISWHLPVIETRFFDQQPRILLNALSTIFWLRTNTHY